MNGRGRPLRFVAIIALGWAGTRIAILWPEGAPVSEASETALPVRMADMVARQPLMSVASAPRAMLAMPGSEARRIVPGIAMAGDASEAVVPAAFDEDRGLRPILGAPPAAVQYRAASPMANPLAANPPTSRWSGSAWFVTRRSAPASGPMLGGDQAGVRIGYTLDVERRISLYGRGSAPLGMRGSEVAIGVEWQPGELPVRAVAEYRIGIDGQMGGPTVALIGGVDAVPLARAFTLEAYGQAGAVARGRADPFADGALRVTRPATINGGVRVAVGAGIWGAAQREATRLDLGPSAVVTLPLGDAAVRVAFDWRERIAGDARPGSGPALTLGADF